MTLSAANPGGWSLNEVLTSAQMTFLQNELLKAVDGVGGGTYTLGSTLTFQGADVSFVSDVNLNSGSELNFNAGAVMTGQIDVDANGDMTFLSGSSLTMAVGSTLNISGTMSVANLTITNSMQLSSAVLSDDALSQIDIIGAINVNSGGELNLVTGSVQTVDASFLNLANGSSLDVDATSSIACIGSIGLNSGGQMLVNGATITLQTGGQILGQNGSIIRVEDAEDLLINGATETFRLSMTPFQVQAQSTGELRWQPVSLGKWRQQDATAGGYFIAFALPLPPGDVVQSVTAVLTGGAGAGHGGVLPGVMPQLELVSVSTAGVFTTLAETSDTSPSAAFYDTSHDILLDSTTETAGSMPQTVGFDPLYVVIRGEQGGVDNTLELTAILGTCIANSFRGTSATMHY